MGIRLQWLSLCFFRVVHLAPPRPRRIGFRAKRKVKIEDDEIRPWHEYREGLRYMRSVPLVLAIALLSVGWPPAAARPRFSSPCRRSGLQWRSRRNRVIWGFAGLVCWSAALSPTGSAGGFPSTAYNACIYQLHRPRSRLCSLRRSQRFDLALLFIFSSRAVIARELSPETTPIFCGRSAIAIADAFFST